MGLAVGDEGAIDAGGAVVVAGGGGGVDDLDGAGIVGEGGGVDFYEGWGAIGGEVGFEALAVYGVGFVGVDFSGGADELGGGEGEVAEVGAAVDEPVARL